MLPKPISLPPSPIPMGRLAEPPGVGEQMVEVGPLAVAGNAGDPVYVAVDVAAQPFDGDQYIGRLGDSFLLGVVLAGDG